MDHQTPASQDADSENNIIADFSDNKERMATKVELSENSSDLQVEDSHYLENKLHVARTSLITSWGATSSTTTREGRIELENPANGTLATAIAKTGNKTFTTGITNTGDTSATKIRNIETTLSTRRITTTENTMPTTEIVTTTDTAVPVIVESSTVDTAITRRGKAFSAGPINIRIKFKTPRKGAAKASSKRSRQKSTASEKGQAKDSTKGKAKRGRPKSSTRGKQKSAATKATPTEEQESPSPKLKGKSRTKEKATAKSKSANTMLEEAIPRTRTRRAAAVSAREKAISSSKGNRTAAKEKATPTKAKASSTGKTAGRKSKTSNIKSEKAAQEAEENNSSVETYTIFRDPETFPWLEPPPAENMPEWVTKLPPCFKIKTLTKDFVYGFVKNDDELHESQTLFERHTLTSFVKWSVRQKKTIKEKRIMWLDDIETSVIIPGIVDSVCICRCTYGGKPQPPKARKSVENSEPAPSQSQASDSFVNLGMGLQSDMQSMSTSTEKSKTPRKRGPRKPSECVSRKVGCDAKSMMRWMTLYIDFRIDRNSSQKIKDRTLLKLKCSLVNKSIKVNATKLISVRLPSPQTHTNHNLAGQKLHPRTRPEVIKKIHEYYQAGVRSCTTMEKLIRQFVINELCATQEQKPLPEDTSYFPALGSVSRIMKNARMSSAKMWTTAQVQEPVAGIAAEIPMHYTDISPITVTVGTTSFDEEFNLKPVMSPQPEEEPEEPGYQSMQPEPAVEVKQTSLLANHGYQQEKTSYSSEHSMPQCNDAASCDSGPESDGEQDSGSSAETIIEDGSRNDKWISQLPSSFQIKTIAEDFVSGFVLTDEELKDVLTLYQRHTLTSFVATGERKRSGERMLWLEDAEGDFISPGNVDAVCQHDCVYGGKPHVRRKSEPAPKPVEDGNSLRPPRKRRTPRMSMKVGCSAKMMVKWLTLYSDFKVEKNSKQTFKDREMLKLKCALANSSLDVKATKLISVRLPFPHTHTNHNKTGQKLHPRTRPEVVQKIHEYVHAGVRSCTMMEKMIRHYVQTELCANQEQKPDPDDTSYFPNVGSIGRHIKNARRSIDGGEPAPDPNHVKNRLWHHRPEITDKIYEYYHQGVTSYTEMKKALQLFIMYELPPEQLPPEQPSPEQPYFTDDKDRFPSRSFVRYHMKRAKLSCKNLPPSNTLSLSASRVSAATPNVATQNMVAQHTATQNTVAQHTATQNVLVQHTTTQDMIAQHTAIQNTIAQHTPTQHTIAQHTPTHHTVAQHAPTQNPVAQLTAPQNAMAQHTVVQHTVPLNTVVQHTVPLNTVVQHTVAQHTMAHHSLPQNTLPQPSVPLNAMVHHTLAHHTLAHHTAAHHSMAQHHNPLNTARALSGKKRAFAESMSCMPTEADLTTYPPAPKAARVSNSTGQSMFPGPVHYPMVHHQPVFPMPGHGQTFQWLH